MRRLLRLVVLSAVLLTLVGAGAAAQTAQPLAANYYDQSWAPDGRRYVEEHEGRVLVFHASGAVERQLASGASPYARPVWSPDGAWIAFSAPGEIRVVRPDGTEARRVTTGSGLHLHWSPDGRFLLYRALGLWELRLLDVSSGERTVVAAYGICPQFSPDGKRIAYDAERGLLVKNLDGGEELVVRTHGPNESLVLGCPSWSPDGSELASTGVAPQGVGSPSQPWREVYAARADGGGVRRLTGPLDPAIVTSSGSHSPRWWPNGSRISFVRWWPHEYVMNPDGTCQQPAPALDRQSSPWRPGASLPLAPLDCFDLRYLQVVRRDERAGVGLPLTYRFRVDNHGTRSAALLVVEPSSGRAAALSVPGRCSGGAPLRCRLEVPPRRVSEVAVSVTSPRAGRVRTMLTLTSPEQEERHSHVWAWESEVVRCTIEGTPRRDVLLGTAGRDRICGRGGNDRIAGRAGEDWIDAGPGDDVVYGGPGRDTILGGPGRDVIHARDGERDVIRCGPGRDTVHADRRDVVARDCERVHRR